MKQTQVLNNYTFKTVFFNLWFARKRYINSSLSVCHDCFQANSQKQWYWKISMENIYMMASMERKTKRWQPVMFCHIQFLKIKLIREKKNLSFIATQLTCWKICSCSILRRKDCILEGRDSMKASGLNVIFWPWWNFRASRYPPINWTRARRNARDTPSPKRAARFRSWRLKEFT